MSQEKYIGMDVHQATISVAVMDAGGKLIMECLLETKAATIVEFMKERAVEGWQQKRSDRCTKAGRVVAHQPSQAGLPRRTRGAHLERVGAQLSDHYQRCHAGDESGQSPVSQLGHSMRWHNRLRSTSSRRVVGQDR